MGVKSTVTVFPLSSGPYDPQNHDDFTMTDRTAIVKGYKDIFI